MIWLPGNYLVLIVVMTIYGYNEKIGELLLPLIFLYNKYDNKTKNIIQVNQLIYIDMNE